MGCSISTIKTDFKQWRFSKQNSCKRRNGIRWNLGQLILFENNTKKEIRRWISVAWKKVWTLKKIMKNSNLNIKKRLYKITVSLYYGCQTWSL